ncbi:unnamed protein product [Echinostoma caproni]|uniref:Uncharacterized protein n=1 Tax=Echinostoma caproni TaxID=27848 RepID=A0A183AWM8_9TREM|nr:unnamed protein product [Echinostoma caproni]
MDRIPNLRDSFAREQDLGRQNSSLVIRAAPGIHYRRTTNERFRKYPVVSGALASPPRFAVRGCSGHSSGHIDRL